MTLYDESAVDLMKRCSTVDESQIIEFRHLKTPSFDSWLSSELPGSRTELEDGQQPPNGLDDLSTSVTSSQSPGIAAINPVVPRVVEDKEAEDDDDGDVGRPTRRRGDRRPVTSTIAVSLSSSPRQSLHRPSHAFNHAAFDDHSGLLTPMNGGGFHQPAFIPLSVCTPKDEPQTVPCIADVSRADTCKLERKRERNRLAAQKCRQRKMEQINILQERVQKLNRTKVDLERTAEDLRRHVDLLQRHLRQHISAGCQLAHRNSSNSSFRHVT